MATCINCNNEINTPYCPHCGQRNPVKGISFSNLWSDFASRTYGFDGMFPRTLRDLTLRPGDVARAYIEGNRVKYYGPVGYFFLMITLYLLLASLLGIDLVEFTMKSGLVDSSQQGEGQQEISKAINLWTNDNLRLVSFVVAVFTVFFTWLYFRKSKLNIIQSSVLIFFVSGHVLWMSFALLIIYRISGFVLSASWQLLFSTSFLIFALANFYTYQARWKVIIKGILVYITAYTCMILIVIGLLVLRLSTDKEFYEKLRPKNNKEKPTASPATLSQ
jgi:Protein of unknown function (DUF3667)